MRPVDVRLLRCAVKQSSLSSTRSPSSAGASSRCQRLDTVVEGHSREPGQHHHPQLRTRGGGLPRREGSTGRQPCWWEEHQDLGVETSQGSTRPRTHTASLPLQRGAPHERVSAISPSAQRERARRMRGSFERASASMHREEREREGERVISSITPERVRAVAIHINYDRRNLHTAVKARTHASHPNIAKLSWLWPG